MHVSALAGLQDKKSYVVVWSCCVGELFFGAIWPAIPHAQSVAGCSVPCKACDSLQKGLRWQISDLSSPLEMKSCPWHCASMTPCTFHTELASHAEAEAAAVTPSPRKASPAALAAAAAATPTPAEAALGPGAAQAADAGALTPNATPGAQPAQATPAAAANEDVGRWMAQLRAEHAYALPFTFGLGVCCLWRVADSECCMLSLLVARMSIVS